MSRKIPRFGLVGGFLGAGKTTAILQFARWLHEAKRLKVGIITNDQANGLVDTALANGAQFVVREIGGGCFCCKSETLVEAMGSFSAKVQPDVLIGEPVGSCTDLVSTVLGPLRSVYRTEYELAPLSILVDPFRAERITGSNGAAAGGFSEEVNYIYRKQIEEAEIIVVNKCDVFERKRMSALCKRLKEQHPSTEVLRVSARTGDGFVEWWERLLTRRHSAGGSMPMDYQVYADGEARLGWVNGEYETKIAPALRKAWKNGVGIHGDLLLSSLAKSVKMAFRARKIEVAHLKIAILPEGDGAGENGAIQWVETRSEPEFTRRLSEPFTGGTLLLNLRVEAAPDVLSAVVEGAFESVSGQVRVKRREYAAFKPSPPKPTHRLTETASASVAATPSSQEGARDASPRHLARPNIARDRARDEASRRHVATRASQPWFK